MKCEYLKGTNNCTILDSDCDVIGDYCQKNCGVRKTKRKAEKKK